MTGDGNRNPAKTLHMVLLPHLIATRWGFGLAGKVERLSGMGRILLDGFNAMQASPLAQLLVRVTIGTSRG